MRNVVILSCWFGFKFNKPLHISSIKTFKQWLYANVKNRLPYKILNRLDYTSIIPQAPLPQKNCYFYSNNKSLKTEIIDKGWIFCFIDEKIENGESISSSLLAKKVKFLQLDDQVYKDVEHIIYMDSRRISDDVAQIIEINQKGILIRYEAKFKPSIWNEVEEAKDQERYAKHMDDTIVFINDKIAKGYTDNKRVMNTGIIAYSMAHKRTQIMSFCNEVYDACMMLKQPECQILWCILSEPYIDIIQAVESPEIKSRSGL